MRSNTETVNPSAASAPEAGRRVGFLFNHQHLHQIAHSAPIAFELIRAAPGLSVSLLASSQAQFDYLQRAIPSSLRECCELRLLHLPGWLRMLCLRLDRLGSATKLATLGMNLPIFRALDVLVVPEQNSLALRHWFGVREPKLVYTHHGAGDRAVGFGPDTAEFDLVLLPGAKVRDRLMALGLLHADREAIVGYAKFDLYGSADRGPSLFANDRPTVLYNPHFSADLSSWYAQGLAVLEQFYHSQKYNLIFAPHVMLYERGLRFAPSLHRFVAPGKIAERYRQCPHLLIDTGSERSIDMTYVRAADLYLGDVSSQVYEFLRWPRPCLFLNAQGVEWRGNPDYLHWTTGPVIDQAGQIEAAVDAAFASHGDYLAVQQRLFSDTFDLDERPSAQRGAQAILSAIGRWF